jgi:hypothetical protein
LKAKKNSHDSSNIDIETLIKYKDLESFAQRIGLQPKLMDEFKKEIQQSLGVNESTLERRLSGLREEDEFALISLILGNVEQITPLAQKQPVNWEKYGVPDFLMGVNVPKDVTQSQKPLAQRMFVEVKSALGEKENFVLRLQMFGRLKRFCELYRPIPLYFAVKARTVGLSQWFLLSMESVARLGKVNNVKIGGREEACIFIPVLEMPREDFSGLWLANYYVLVPQGLKITKKYRTSSASPIIDDRFGRLVEITAKNGDNVKEIHFGSAIDISDLLSYLIVQRIRFGEDNVVKQEDGYDVTREAGVNYWIPFYWLLLDSYLDLREKLEPQLKKSPNPKPTTSYFLQTFSDEDATIAAGIRGVIWELHEKGIILPMKMLPERMFSNAKQEEHD